MRTFLLAALILMLALFWESAQAKFALAFDDPATQGIDLLIEDQGPYDLADAPGIIEFCAETGPLLTCTTGVSKPAEGTVSAPELALNVNFIRYIAGSLDIMLTDTDFSTAASTAVAEIHGGIEGGDSVTFKFFSDPGNQEFHRGFQIASFGPFQTPDLSITGQDEAPTSPVGSLTLTIEMNGPGSPEEINGSFISKLVLLPSGADVDVPDVVGLEEAVARDTIENDGLTIGTVTTQTSEDVAAGNVISQDPAAGTNVAPATSVDLVVSSGPEETQVPVENPPGLSGSWYDPDLNGEGYEVAVTPVGLLLYYYGRDVSADRLWLTSSIYDGAIVFGQSITLTLLQTTSGTFSSPSPELEEWGTLVIIFDTCTSGRVQMTGKDGTKTANIVKLIGIGELDCDL